MKIWRWAVLGLAGLMLTVQGCWGNGCGATRALPKLGGFMGPPNLTGLLPGTISSGVDVLNWIVGISFLGAFLCIIATVALGTIGGIGSATFRRMAATFVCTGIGGVVLKAFSIAIADWTARHSWIVGTIALIVGIAVAALFVWGHVNWLEKILHVDLDRDGDIGVEAPPVGEASNGQRAESAAGTGSVPGVPGDRPSGPPEGRGRVAPGQGG